MNVVAISGSLREGSNNTALLRAMQTLAPEGMSIEILNIDALPLFNQDLESSFPQSAQTLKDKIEAADGVIFATPEYNRSISGVLKNAIDWASRPWGKNSFAGKPVLTAGVSVGKIGTAVAQSHLRQIMVYLDALVVGQPELYLSNDIFDDTGALVNDTARELVKNALVALSNRARLR